MTAHNFRKGAKVRTSFECPDYSARIGTVLKSENGTTLVLVQAIEKEAETEEVWINNKYLSLTI
jgi:hypothetical protein